MGRVLRWGGEFSSSGLRASGFRPMRFVHFAVWGVKLRSFRDIWKGYLRVPLRGYYKGTTRVPLKGSRRV